MLLLLLAGDYFLRSTGLGFAMASNNKGCHFLVKIPCARGLIGGSAS